MAGARRIDRLKQAGRRIETDYWELLRFQELSENSPFPREENQTPELLFPFFR